MTHQPSRLKASRILGTYNLPSTAFSSSPARAPSSPTSSPSSSSTSSTLDDRRLKLPPATGSGASNISPRMRHVTTAASYEKTHKLAPLTTSQSHSSHPSRTSSSSPSSSRSRSRPHSPSSHITISVASQARRDASPSTTMPLQLHPSQQQQQQNNIPVSPRDPSHRLPPHRPTKGAPHTMYMRTTSNSSSLMRARSNSRSQSPSSHSQYSHYDSNHVGIDEQEERDHFTSLAHDHPTPPARDHPHTHNHHHHHRHSSSMDFTKSPLNTNLLNNNNNNNPSGVGSVGSSSRRLVGYSSNPSSSSSAHYGGEMHSHSAGAVSPIHMNEGPDPFNTLMMLTELLASNIAGQSGIKKMMDMIHFIIKADLTCMWKVYNEHTDGPALSSSNSHTISSSPTRSQFLCIYSKSSHAHAHNAPVAGSRIPAEGLVAHCISTGELLKLNGDIQHDWRYSPEIDNTTGLLNSRHSLLVPVRYTDGKTVGVIMCVLYERTLHTPQHLASGFTMNEEAILRSTAFCVSALLKQSSLAETVSLQMKQSSIQKQIQDLLHACTEIGTLETIEKIQDVVQRLVKARIVRVYMMSDDSKSNRSSVGRGAGGYSLIWRGVTSVKNASHKESKENESNSTATAAAPPASTSSAGPSYIRYHLGESIVGGVALNQQLANVDDVHSDWRLTKRQASAPSTESMLAKIGGTSCLCVPIKDFMNKTLAVIEAVDRTEPCERDGDLTNATAFSKDDVFLMQSLAGAATSIIRNAQLHDEAHSRHRQTDALLHIIDLMSTDLSSSLVIPRIIDAAYKLVSCERISLFLVRDLIPQHGSAQSMDMTSSLITSSPPTPITSSPSPSTFSSPHSRPDSNMSVSSSSSSDSRFSNDNFPPPMSTLTSESRIPSQDMSAAVSSSHSSHPKELVCVVSKDESMRGRRIEWGTGLVGTVAMTMKTLNISDTTNDSRFNQEFDRKTKFSTRNCLTVPILDHEGNCVAVLQAVNRLPDSYITSSYQYAHPDNEKHDASMFETFSLEDINILESLAKSAGIMLHKSRFLHTMIVAEKKSRALLELFKVVAKSDETPFFETIDGIVDVIYNVSDCDRVTLYFVDSEHQELFSIVSKEFKGIRFPLGSGISGWVAKYAQVANIKNARNDLRFDSSFDKKTGYKTKSVLCVPVVNSDGKCLAVIQCINKKSQYSKNSSLIHNVTKGLNGKSQEIAKSSRSLRSRRSKTKHSKAKHEAQVIEFNDDDVVILTAICDQISDCIRAHMDVAISSHYGADNPQIRSLVSLYMRDDNSNARATGNSMSSRCVTPAIGASDRNNIPSELGISGPMIISEGIPTGLTPLQMPLSPEYKNEQMYGVYHRRTPQPASSSARLAPSQHSSPARRPNTVFGSGIGLAQSSPSPGPNYLSVNPLFATVGKHSSFNNPPPPTPPILSSSNSIFSTNIDLDQVDKIDAAREEKRKREAALTDKERAEAKDDKSHEIEEEMPVGACPPAEAIDSWFTWLAQYEPSEMCHAKFSSSFIAHSPDAFSTPHPKTKPSRTQTLLSASRYGGPSFSPSAPLSANITLDMLEGMDFDPFSVDDDVLVEGLGLIFEATGLTSTLLIPGPVLQSFLLAVRAGYNANPFHNFKHGFSVCHCAFTMLRHSPVSNFFSAVHVLSLLVSGLCHDIDHPGNNNTFEVLTLTEKALIYSDVSVLEFHHSYRTFLILRQNKCNVMRHLPIECQRMIRNQIIQSILSTDMSSHFDKIKRLISLDSLDNLDKNNEKDRVFLLGVLIHSADLCGQTLPWQIAKQWEERITLEFNAQASALTKLGLPVDSFMQNLDDWENRATLQMNFIDFVLVPWWQQFVRLVPALQIFHTQLLNNRSKFAEIKQRFQQAKDREREVEQQQNKTPPSNSVLNSSGTHLSSHATTSSGPLPILIDSEQEESFESNDEEQEPEQQQHHHEHKPEQLKTHATSEEI